MYTCLFSLSSNISFVSSPTFFFIFFDSFASVLSIFFFHKKIALFFLVCSFCYQFLFSSFVFTQVSFDLCCSVLLPFCLVFFFSFLPSSYFILIFLLLILSFIFILFEILSSAPCLFLISITSFILVSFSIFSTLHFSSIILYTVSFLSSHFSFIDSLTTDYIFFGGGDEEVFFWSLSFNCLPSFILLYLFLLFCTFFLLIFSIF